MKSAFFLLTTLAFALNANELVIQTKSCPSENSAHSFLGFRTRNGRCVTAIFRAQITSSKTMPNGTVEEQAKMYCASQFKMGTLVSYKDFEHAAKNLERTGLYDPEENGNWQVALCLHDAYNNCFRQGKNNCVYLPRKKACYWEHTYIEIQAQELPYGRPCKPIEGNGHLCECSRCTTTEWTSWTNYTHYLGFQFRTRYRPENAHPCHNCHADTNFCCAQHEVTSGLNISSIPCLNGGTLDPWIGDRCKCRENFTGMFCEIGHSSPSWSNTRINLTVLQALALLLVWTVGITLICLLCAGGLTHLSSGEKRRSAPSVVVNIQNAGDNDNSSPMNHETAANERAREPERSPYRENSGKELNHRSFVARRHEQQDNQWLVHRGVVERLCDGKMQSDASRNKSLIHISSNNNAYARQIPISNV